MILSKEIKNCLAFPAQRRFNKHPRPGILHDTLIRPFMEEGNYHPDVMIALVPLNFQLW